MKSNIVFLSSIIECDRTRVHGNSYSYHFWTELDICIFFKLEEMLWSSIENKLCID